MRSTRHDLTRPTWWRATGIRAVRTTAQTAVALIGSSTLVTEVSWTTVASGSLLAGVLAVLTAVASTPPEAG